jgi:uncharacterized protein YhaN
VRIESIHIEGFGVWNDRTWESLSTGLNVFHGPNETGKSTLMAFIRSILFGLDRRGHARRYEPLKGGTHGGWLDVRVDGRPIRIERRAGRHVRGEVTVYEGESAGSDTELDNLLGGMTRTLYHNVFAFGLEELEQFRTLQDNEIAKHISGASLGIGASRWAAVQRDLETRQSSLFLPRGVNGAINVALKELESVREDLDRTEHQPEEYWTARESRTRLAAEVAGLEDVVADLKQRAAHYEKRLKSRPFVERRRAIEQKLKALPEVESYPEGGVERLDLLRRQLRGLETEQQQVLREADQRRRRRFELKAAMDPGEHDRRAYVLEMLRGLVPRMDAARRVYESSLEQRRAIEQERSALESAMESVRPPSKGAFLAFLGLIVLGAAGFLISGQAYVSAVMFAVIIAPLLWYRRRRSVFASMSRQFDACLDRLASCTMEVGNVEEEARQIEAELRRLTGKTEIVQEDLDARAADLEKFDAVFEELRRLDDVLERTDTELDRVRRQMDERRTTINALFEEAGAADEATFLQRAEIFKQRQQLMAERERIPVDPEPGLLFDVRINEEEAYNAVRAELSEMERRLAEARHESGRVEERITSMERSEERSRALARQEVVLAKIDASAEMWAVVTLCRALLDETRKVYETDRQPQVLRHASRFFSVMTEGRYPRVIAPLDGTEIQAERDDGVRLVPELLSRGTAEQLYLAMRLALVRDYAGHVAPLPVVFDDVFVNFDPPRTLSTFRAVRELADTHQVLLFTCHPHIVNIACEIVPEAKIFPLQ